MCLRRVIFLFVQVFVGLSRVSGLFTTLQRSGIVVAVVRVSQCCMGLSRTFTGCSMLHKFPQVFEVSHLFLRLPTFFVGCNRFERLRA